MSKPIIGVMNGAFASVWGVLKDRKYMSDIVQEIISTIDFPNGYFLHIEKGGMWDSPDRKMKEFLVEHDKAENNLILIGKSGGGWDMNKPILYNFVSNCLYTKRIGVTVDATYPFREKQFKYKGYTKFINFYQPNGFLHGSDCIVENQDCHVEQHLLDSPEVDHFNIIEKDFIKVKIKQLIEEIKC